MPLDEPVTSAGETTWTAYARHGTASTVSLTIRITVEGDATGADGDAALQGVVDALIGQPRFSGVSGVKAFQSDVTQAMLPTA